MAAPFVMTWQRSIRDAPMPAARKGFGLILSTWGNGDGTRIFPSIETLTDVGYSRATVYRHLGDLEEDGWIVCERRGGGRIKGGKYASNVYRLTLPRGSSGETKGVLS